MRDRDVRRALFQKVLCDHAGQADTRVLNELGLKHGAGRVDVAVVNGHLHGFEIKSDADTLERLPGQIEIYNAVLDKVTLVCGERHAEKARRLIPEWWGVKVAVQGPRQAVHFETVETARVNRDVDPVAVAQLLWRDEVIEILSDMGLPGMMLRKPRAALYRDLASFMELDDLRRTVRQRLKSRENWRGHRPPA